MSEIDLQEKNLYDHIEIGEKLKLFFFDIVTPGSCFFLPHGTIILNRLIDFVRKIYKQMGYEEVNTPVMCDKRLWDVSGTMINTKRTCL